jgi:hypothetical protein
MVGKTATKSTASIIVVPFPILGLDKIFVSTHPALNDIYRIYEVFKNHI